MLAAWGQGELEGTSGFPLFSRILEVPPSQVQCRLYLSNYMYYSPVGESTLDLRYDWASLQLIKVLFAQDIEGFLHKQQVKMG